MENATVKVCDKCSKKRNDQLSQKFFVGKMFICQLCNVEVEGAMVDTICNKCSTDQQKCKCCME